MMMKPPLVMVDGFGVVEACLLVTVDARMTPKSIFSAVGELEQTSVVTVRGVVAVTVVL